MIYHRRALYGPDQSLCGENDMPRRMPPYGNISACTTDNEDLVTCEMCRLVELVCRGNGVRPHFRAYAVILASAESTSGSGA
jgi:hypothetical protein